MIFIPPRHGKSEFISKYFPAWYIGKYPDRRIILTSYEAAIASSWGRKARDILLEYGEQVFDMKVTQDVKASNWWETRNGGGMMTAGSLGPITGKGANLFIIDDPIKNFQEALSSTHRENLWEWYRSTAYTRLEPGASLIIAMARWDRDDIAGRILKEIGDNWVILKLPAIATRHEKETGRKPGDPLWPERFPLQTLNEIKNQVQTYWWEALYQQSPLERRGTGIFQPQWFEIIDPGNVSTSLTKVRYWDLAATPASDGEDPDWTVGVLMGIRNNIYYVLDIRRDRNTPARIEALVRKTAEIDGTSVRIFMEQEPGASGVNTIDHYRRNILQGFSFRGDKVSGSKILRAMPFSAAAEAGRIKLVKASWNKDFLEELTNFSGNETEHDDQVDAACGAFEKLSTPKNLFVWGR